MAIWCGSLNSKYSQTRSAELSDNGCTGLKSKARAASPNFYFASLML
jgi:hypothetical protein